MDQQADKLLLQIRHLFKTKEETASGVHTQDKMIFSVINVNEHSKISEKPLRLSIYQ